MQIQYKFVLLIVGVAAVAAKTDMNDNEIYLPEIQILPYPQPNTIGNPIIFPQGQFPVDFDTPNKIPERDSNLQGYLDFNSLPGLQGEGIPADETFGSYAPYPVSGLYSPGLQLVEEDWSEGSIDAPEPRMQQLPTGSEQSSEGRRQYGPTRH